MLGLTSLEIHRENFSLIKKELFLEFLEKENTKWRKKDSLLAEKLMHQDFQSYELLPTRNISNLASDSDYNPNIFLM